MHFTKRIVTVLLGLLAACVAPPSHAQTAASFDGRWDVVLKCTDTGEGTNLVRGYTYVFFVNIVNGKLDGRFDEPTPPAYVRYVGTVAADGTLAIKANGLTGAPAATLGSVRPATPYAYTLKGKLDATQGKATRVESRPCTATFSRVK